MAGINFNLKGKIVQRYGSQIVAARTMGIQEAKLSHIVRGHSEPNERERKALEKALGRNFVKKVLNGRNEKLAV